MFEIGKEYHRAHDTHYIYGGQRYGGIATPVGQDFVMLVSSPKGAAHGYKDAFIDDLFHYTGKGQSGDMRFIKGDRAIRDHVEDDKKLLLFFQSRSGYLIFRGEAFYEGYYNCIREGKRFL